MNKNLPQLPKHLSHTPIYGLAYSAFDEYERLDGGTDALYITVGLATFNARPTPPSRTEALEVLSVKVWRYGFENNRWSRLSEEIPAARLVDAVITLTRFLRGSDPIPAGVFEGQTEPLYPELRSKMKGFEDYEALILKRLARLQHELKALALPPLEFEDIQDSQS